MKLKTAQARRSRRKMVTWKPMSAMSRDDGDVGDLFGQQVLFPINQIARVKRCQFKSMAVGDGVCRAGFDAVAAENATVVVDVVNFGVTLGAADAVFFGVLGGFNVNAIRRTSRRA